MKQSKFIDSQIIEALEPISATVHYMGAQSVQGVLLSGDISPA